MTVTAFYNDSTSVTVTDYELNGYLSIPGTHKIEVVYAGKSTSFSVTVNSKSLVSISIISLPKKLIYFVGEELETAGLLVEAKFNNGTKSIVSDYTLEGFDGTVGVNTVTVVYGGKKDTFNVTVKIRVPSSLCSSIFTINNDVISKINEGTTVAQLLSGVDGGEFCEVYDGDTQVSSDTVVGTGMTVKLLDDGKVIALYSVIVTGDTNGDGKVTVTDMLAVKAHILKKNLLVGLACEAADTNGDSNISITDFLVIKAKILGKGTIIAR